MLPSTSVPAAAGSSSLVNPPTSKRKTKRAVTWSVSCGVLLYERPQRQEDLMATWWQPSDYTDFRKNARMVAKIARAHGVKFVETDFLQESFYGLEHFASEQALQERMTRRILLVDSVLDEQTRQQLTGELSATGIGAISRGVSLPAQVQANRRASKLHAETQKDNKIRNKDGRSQHSMLKFAAPNSKKLTESFKVSLRHNSQIVPSGVSTQDPVDDVTAAMA